MELFSALGFQWNRAAVPDTMSTHATRRVAFRLHRMLDEFIWNASMLEGNPFTFAQVKTLLDGVSVGGQKIGDHQQALRLVRSFKHLVTLVKAGTFRMDKVTFSELNGLVGRHDAPAYGHFRGESLETGSTHEGGPDGPGPGRPPASAAGASELSRAFDCGLQALQREVPHPFEKAAAFFLFGALQQFFPDANKRTSDLMMNGILMSAGIDAISVPAAKAQEFHDNLARFRRHKDGTDMLTFLLGCHPDSEPIQKPAEQATGSPPL